MIADECAKLRKQLEEVKRAEERQNIVEQLDVRRKELIELRDQVLSVTDSLSAILKRTSIQIDLDIAKVIERVKRIREALQSDPLSITKGRDFSYMKKAFEKFSQDGSAVAKKTWEIYMPRARPKLDTNQVAQAEQQNDFKTIASRLVARANYADKLGKKPPANEEEFKEIESTWEDIRQMISKLPQVASDPKVQEFLKAANSRSGAPLELLTEEVNKWLTENNISEKYRITTM